MKESSDSCPDEKVHRVEYRMLSESLRELKERVTRVEATMTRGVMLLVANLAGVLVTLAREFFKHSN